jgi:superoxide dismutase, Fe-Mn family
MSTTRRRFLQTLGTASAVVAANGLVAPLARAAAAATPAAAAPPAAAPPAAPAGPFTLPALPYPPDALEPFLDAATMTIHHDKHHAAYVNNLNKAIAGKPELAGRPLDALLRGLEQLPADVRTAVRNQGGGHWNHSLLWPSLDRNGARAPSGELAAAIDQGWGSFPAFQEKFNASAMSVFGSGWTWLVRDPKGALAIVNTANQDCPLTQGATPLLGLDVWEHAYYLKYQNRRADYVTAFAQVVDWDVIAMRFADATAG